jgi:uncharacterized membrane protein
MTAVLIIVPSALVVIAAVMLLLPALMPPTLPLGVSVPVERQAEPVIRTALRRYRLLVGVAWLVAVILAVALAAVSPLTASLVPILLFVIAASVAYIIARQMIVRTKHDEQWYKDVPVRLVGSVTVDPVHTSVPAGWFAASLLLLAIATAIGVGVYDSLPQQVPVHWGLAGVADRFDVKNVGNVFGPLIVGAIVTLVLFALSFVNRVAPIRAAASASAADNELRARAKRAGLATLLGRMMFVIALAISWLSVASWLLPDARWPVTIGTIALLVLILLVLVAFLVRWRRIVAQGIPKPGAEHGGVDSPDDDRFWKAGIFYVNRDDPAIMVQRRFGVGWTMNLGHPAGVAIGVALVAVIVGVVVFTIVSNGKA